MTEERAESAAQGRDGRRVRVLAAASGGGHWRQLRRLRPAFAGCDVVWATVDPRYVLDGGSSGEGQTERVCQIDEVSRWSMGKLPWQLVRAWRLIGREKPDVVVSTGALPGLLVLVAARLRGTRTVWLDSLANVDRMSLSGRLARRFAHLWLTQWPHLARPEGPRCYGSVLE